MTIFERIMALLTGAAIIVAGLTAVFILSQRNDARKDQRPWVRVWIDVDSIQRDSANISVMHHWLNSGKTPAKNVDVEFSIERVVNGYEPMLSDDHRYGRLTAGVGFPNHQLDVHLFAHDFVPTEADDFLATKIFFVVYGIATYTDVYGTRHWTKFCQPIIHPPGDFTYKKCTDYSDTDDD
jgi:hypothetical protein